MCRAAQVCKVFLGTACLVGLALNSSGQVSPGIDELRRSGFAILAGKRVGLICNQGSISRDGRNTWQVLRAAKGINLVALFAPEHGIDGNIQAGKYVPNIRHAASGLPVYSLHGPTRKPTARMLAGLDALVFDLQDIGCRSYTYISTMGLAMQAASETGVEFVVLDRPNPLGGVRVEGPILDPSVRSFVGQFEIPYVYGMTCGELARWINRSGWIGRPARLTVVPMAGWRRSMVWKDTGLRWVATSPNIPTADHVAKYVATGWLGESGTMSNGIGGPDPFGMGGAGWLNPERFAAALNARGLPGVAFVPTFYTINSGRWKGSRINGAAIKFTDRNAVELTPIGLEMMAVAQRIGGRGVFDRAAAEKVAMFDKVSGGRSARALLLARKDPAGMIASWRSAAARFRSQRKSFLLYN